MGLEWNMSVLALGVGRLGRVVFGWVAFDLTGTAVLVAADLLDDELGLLLEKSLRSDLLLGGGSLDLAQQMTSGFVDLKLFQKLRDGLLGAGGGWGGLLSDGLCWCLDGRAH